MFFRVVIEIVGWCRVEGFFNVSCYVMERWVLFWFYFLVLFYYVVIVDYIK